MFSYHDKRYPVKWEKRHISNIRGNEYDIWVFYREETPFYKKQLTVCHSEEEFEHYKKIYGLK